MTKELAKTLTTALVQFIDRKRPEGTMCCSNYECERIEKAFKGGRYDVVESFIKKKLEVPLTPFQQCLNGILRKVFFAEVSDPTSFIIKCVQDNTKELLALAKKELFKLWDENMKDEYARGKRDGVTIGYNKAMKEYNESVAYHFPNMPVNPYEWECDGTHCTNPQMDCVNCPRKTTGGFNTQSETS